MSPALIVAVPPAEHEFELFVVHVSASAALMRKPAVMLVWFMPV
jgi:hypothetical protein